MGHVEIITKWFGIHNVLNSNVFHISNSFWPYFEVIFHTFLFIQTFVHIFQDYQLLYNPCQTIQRMHQCTVSLEKEVHGILLKRRAKVRGRNRQKNQHNKIFEFYHRRRVRATWKAENQTKGSHPRTRVCGK